MLTIATPFHGAVLNYRHGCQDADGLHLVVEGLAPVGEAVEVNGRAARRKGSRFSAEVCLQGAETDLVATCRGAAGYRSQQVRVVWDQGSFPRYCFAVDDNSFFLRDVAAQKYVSLFDCPYLAILRRLHRSYGTKFVLNLFFSTPEKDFTLDRVRSEYLGRHDALKDFDTGMVYSKADIVCNNTAPEQAAAILRPLQADPNTAEIMDLFTHEQYFWPFYFNYRPDHVERCEAAIRFCTENGYKPVFFEDGFLGAS